MLDNLEETHFEHFLDRINKFWADTITRNQGTFDAFLLFRQLHFEPKKKNVFSHLSDNEINHLFNKKNHTHKSHELTCWTQAVEWIPRDAYSLISTMEIRKKILCYSILITKR